jgi:LysR family glycine cleavage system transcriptional activator
MADAAQALRHLPLNALRVFLAVLRQRSFRRAAEELRVTPQAVSLQIRQLEEALGLQLFDRRARSVEPTADAILLAHHVQAGFDEITEGIRRVTRARQRNRININASPWFATRHLLNRLEGFRDRMPDADLRLTTMVDLPDFVRDEVDVAIQWGYGGWNGLDERLLMPDWKVPCCTPALAVDLKQPADLLDMTLLHPVLSDRLWRDVLAHLGVHGSPRDGIRIADAAALRQAALAGLGVGLISEPDAREDLRSGALVAPFGAEVMRQMPADQVPGFHLVLPRAHRRVPQVAAFADWVEKQDWQGRAGGTT